MARADRAHVVAVAVGPLRRQPLPHLVPPGGGTVFPVLDVQAERPQVAAALPDRLLQVWRQALEVVEADRVSNAIHEARCAAAAAVAPQLGNS